MSPAAKLPITPEELVRVVLKRVPSNKHAKQSDTEYELHEQKRGPTPKARTLWTKAVKEELSRAAKQHHLEPRCGGVTNHKEAWRNREWLCDIVWWEERKRLVLAAESEWGNASEILYDFEKLLVVNSPLKLMIFGTSPASDEADDGQEILKMIRERLSKYECHQIGQTYLLFMFVRKTEGKRDRKAYEFKVPSAGKLPLQQVRFKPIAPAAARISR